MKTLTKPRILTLAAGATAAALLSTVVLASGDGDTKPIENAEAITAMLTAEGYAVEEMEHEDGLIEVEATKDGQEYEIYVDPATSEIIKTELDD